MLGQIYLFNQGYDTARINAEDEKVMECIEHWRRKKTDNIPLLQKDKYYNFPRERTARFIKRAFDEEYGELLLSMMKSDSPNSIMPDEERNKSVLIHGFTIIGSKDKQSLREKFQKVEKALLELPDIYEYDLKLAHTINSFAE